MSQKALQIPVEVYAHTQVSVQGHLHIMAASFKEKYSKKLAAKSTKSANNGQCIIWTGATRNCGARYGVLCCKIDDEWKTLYVHRLSFMFSRNWDLQEMDQPNMDTSHLCHNSLCVNAAHLSYEPHNVNRNRSTSVSVGRAVTYSNQQVFKVK